MAQLNQKKTNRLDLITPQAGKIGFAFDENGVPMKIDEHGNIEEIVNLPKEYLSVFNITSGILMTSGVLEIGKTYSLATFIAGDDFSNVANVIYGTINTVGCIFIATGTTPAVWTNESRIYSDLITENVLKNDTFKTFVKNISCEDKIFNSPSGIQYMYVRKIIIQENSAFPELLYFADIQAGQTKNIKRISDNELNFIVYEGFVDSCFFRYLKY